MDITELLKEKEISNPVKNFADELSDVYEGKKSNELLTKQTAEIGLLLLNKHPNLKTEQNVWMIVAPVSHGDRRYEKIKDLIPEKGFKSAELKNLLVYFFGAEKAEYVERAWDKIRFEMYQTGYARRSFRAPNDRDLYFVNQVNFLISAIPQAFSWGNFMNNKWRFYDLSVAEQVRYSQYFQHNSLFRLWSAALDAGDETVFRQMEDIIFNKDEIGKVTRDVIKALLNSEKQAAWELVEKLLLAAQRQEGLRQTVLEALDETSTGALKYMLKVVISNKLARFSSVVRAVDVWAGFGWESEREKTVNAFLEKASEYLETPEKIPAAVKSANNMDVYMALWAQGVTDVEKCAPFLHELYEQGNAEKRALALKFAFETQNRKIRMPLYYRALEDSDLMVVAWALFGLTMVFHGGADKYREHTQYPELFEKLHKIVKKIETKEKTFSGKIFAWTNITFSRNDALSLMINLIGKDKSRLETVLEYFDEMNASLRTKMTQHILKDFSGYAWETGKTTLQLTQFQREFAFRLLSDRGEFMVKSAFNALQKEIFTDKEITVLQTLLKRKGADFRGKIIKLLLRQPDEKLAVAAENLLKNGDGEQRVAALDILLQLKKSNRLKTETARQVEEFKTRKNISPKEEILLAQLSETAENRQDFSAENGFGLFNAAKSISPVVAPQINPENVYEKRLARNEYAFSVPFAKVKSELEKLGALYLENKDHEYELENWDGSMQTVLLGNVFRNKKHNAAFESKREEFENYPLFEVWEKWFADSGLDSGDLEIITLSIQPRAKVSLPYYSDLMPKEFSKFTYYNDPLINIVEALLLVNPFDEKNEFMLGGSAWLFSSLEGSTLKRKPKENQYYYGNYGDGWQSDNRYQVFYDAIDVVALEDRFVKDLWNLAHWRQFSGREENIKYSFPPLIVFCRAFELGVIGEDEMLRGLMTGENMRILSVKKIREKEFDYFQKFPFLKPLFEKVREHILDIELKRGDTATSVTNLAANLQTVYGARRFVGILKGLGKTPLNRGYYYYYGNDEVNKQRSFSRLLKNCFPLETDTQKDFDALAKDAKLTEKQLIEAAVYAPRWQRFVSAFLNWKGLNSAIWWMHAHTKISGYQEQTAESESEIAKYSAVDLQDFKDGAVDKEWFASAFKQIGKARWEIVYDAAKYISDGNGHRRARLYADVISGKTKIKEIAQKVKTKRDQDFLRVYGLAPLSRANAEKDVLSRYEYLQKFKKESRQFGAQKQTSEALAIRIALENLARNAGYADPIRLTWAMETKQVQRILSSDTQVKSGETVVRLVIDVEGQADILTVKGEKTLKAIPPALKKDKKVLELAEHKKTLREQFRRSRTGLEEAMIRGDEFTFAELENLFAHPVISKHLEKLVFVSENSHGFYQDGKLVSAKNETFALRETDKIRLAHPVDLYESGEWSDYQRHCFDRELKQPFKQIFRELYTPTDDERKEKSISRRYAGHQIQPKKTLALLKTRGWKVDYEEGLQKVFHKEGFTAKMYALADWFSPADVESPTLETVEFHDLKTYKNVAFEEINQRIFSEVMRDIDLVVSVAHAGGVDAEASHSSIEMRAVLLKETLRLFRLENVTIAGNHARIKGKIGDYSVHLGSAVVHKMPGTYLSILPVHSQHRGRIFLPFADDDPKSAELISKVLLLARDNEIQDPTILRQLNS
jgi:hypothetical protein